MALPGGRLAFERAIRRSGLPAPARHVALTIATWADVGTGVIPERFQPSISTLAEATGMSATSVKKHLTVLESAGWLLRDRPDIALARTEHARTQYALMVPTSAQGHGREATMPRSGDDHAMGASGPSHSREATKAWSGDGHKSSCSSDESQGSTSSSPAEPADADPQSEPEPTDGGGGGSDLRSLATHITEHLDYLGKPPKARQRQAIEDGLVLFLEAGWTIEDLAIHLDITGQVIRYAPAVYLDRLNPVELRGQRPSLSLPASPAGGSIRGPVASAAEFEAATVDSVFGPARQDTADGGMWERAMDRARQRMGAGGPPGGPDANMAAHFALRDQLAAQEARKGSHTPFRNYTDQSVYDEPFPMPAASLPPWCGHWDCNETDRMRNGVGDDGLPHVYRCPKCHPDRRRDAA